MLSLGTFLKDRLSRKLNVFLVCLFISTVIWLLISLSKSYTTEIVFPVEHRGLPEDRIVSDPLPEELRLEVHSHGFELLAHKFLARKEPVKVDMSELHYKDPGKRQKAYLPTEELLNKLSRQFPSHTRIKGVQPDTLFVSLTPREKKKVKVIPDLKIQFREQYRLAKQVEVTPSKVTLTGPSTVLDTTYSIPTEKLEIEDLHEDRELQARIRTDSISEKLEADPSKVTLGIKVNEFTEGKVKVALQAKAVPDQYVLKTYPDSVMVHYLVGFQNYEKVEGKMFKAQVPFPEKNERDQEELPIKMVEKPSFVDIVRFEPKRVEFIIRKK